MMATCPNCSVSSRVDPDAMEIEECLEALPIGTWSLAGQQLKTSARTTQRMRCRICGWSILGHIDGETFVGRRDTQTFPEAT